jgi:hypothetical protein
MNLVWLIRYLAIAFDCLAPILDAVWIVGDREKHELQLLLMALDAQLAEWEYPKTNGVRHDWGRNKRLGPGLVFSNHGAGYLLFRVYGPAYEDFVVMINYPKNKYIYWDWSETKRARPLECYNRATWMEILLDRFYRTPLGPEKRTETLLQVGPWTRTHTGMWLCSQ